jgi:hypothetical protein
MEKQDFAVVPAELGKTVGRRNTVTDFIRSQGYQRALRYRWRRDLPGGVQLPFPSWRTFGRRKGAAFHQAANAVGIKPERRPWIHIFFETLRSFAPPFFGRLGSARKPPSWLGSWISSAVSLVLNLAAMMSR